MNFLEIYLLGINVITFMTYGQDKYRAVHGKWRISERRLMSLAAMGGAFGAFLGMWVFRHKIRHRKFRIGVPVLLLIWGMLWIGNR